MLEGLFDENADDFKSQKSKSSSAGSSICKPRSLKSEGETGLVGITNQGATCYLNSLVQTLLFTPELRDAVFQLKEAELGKRNEQQSRRIPLELQMLFANMLLVDKSAVSTTDLTDSFGWQNREEVSQHDVQELNRILFSALEQSLVGLSDSDLLDNLYKGTIVNQICCKECGNISEREENFLDLTVAIAGFSDLGDSLTNSYLYSETLSGKNQYKCSKCDKLVDAEKGSKLRELPPILTFCLLRLGFDYQRMERKKETSNFVFPHQISMAPFMDKISSKCTDYELFSVIVHRGGAYGGHYHAVIKDIDNLGHWSTPAHKQQGSNKVQTKEKDERLHFDHPNDLLMYLLASSPNAMTTEEISQRMLHETGVSWNKKYKKRYGTITKFIRDKPELFSYDESTRRVSGKSQNVTPVSAEDATVPEPEKDVNQEQVIQEVQPNEEKTEEHWFSFDDQRVRPTHKGDIERYYGGKECAYMLYYRQKSLLRPAEANGNPKHLVPQHILSEIEETNSTLRHQREVEEAKQHTVMMKIYMPTKYTFRDSFILAKSGHHFHELEFDNRKTVNELIVAIHSQLPGEDTTGVDLQLYTVKPIDNVLHLLNNLSEDEAQCSAKVASVSLPGVMGFILVSKSAIEKHGVFSGADNEPFKITFSYGELNKVMHLPKSTKMPELCTYALEATGTAPPIYLYTVRKHGKLVELEIFEDQPISEALANDSIVNVGNEPITETLPCDKITFSLEVHVQEIRVQYSMIAHLKDTVSSFVLVILKKLREDHDIPERINLRLRPNNGSTFGPPLFYDRLIKDLHLPDRSILCVEEGKPVKSSQMSVFYNLDNGKVHDVVCVCTQTIESCIQQMVANSAPITNAHSPYHLMTLNWIDEPQDVIYNIDQSLAKAKIKHGDRLALVEGKPPPKDPITINVEYYNDLAQIPCNVSYEQWLVNSIENITLQEQSGCVSNSNASIWSATVGSDITIGELKALFQSSCNVSVESVDYLRLRSCNGRNPGLIYRCDNKSLRAYKVRGPVANMMMEILPNSDQLREDEVILSLREKSMSTNRYGDAVTMSWDISGGATARQLQTQIALKIGCETSSLHLALYEPEKFDWKPIRYKQPSSQGDRKRGKRKTKMAEPSLRKAPYNMEDGDLIGYVIVPSTSNENIDAKLFQTDLDSKFKAMYLNNKREQRKAKGNQEDWISFSEQKDHGKTKSRTEKAITINVGEFSH